MSKAIVQTMVLVSLLLFGCQSKESDTPKATKAMLLLNHTGYPTNGLKTVIFQTDGEASPETFRVVDADETVVFEGSFSVGGPIDNWHTGNAFSGDFSDVKQAGTYTISTTYKGATINSTIAPVLNTGDTTMTVIPGAPGMPASRGASSS